LLNGGSVTTKVSILAHLVRWALLGLEKVEQIIRQVSILAHLVRWALPSSRPWIFQP